MVTSIYVLQWKRFRKWLIRRPVGNCLLNVTKTSPLQDTQASHVAVVTFSKMADKQASSASHTTSSTFWKLAPSHSDISSHVTNAKSLCVTPLHPWTFPEIQKRTMAQRRVERTMLLNSVSGSDDDNDDAFRRFSLGYSHFLWVQRIIQPKFLTSCFFISHVCWAS